MNAKPLPQHLYEKAIELGIKEIHLLWSGGSDNGYLDVQIEPYGTNTQEFNREVEEWAWEDYSYSGAGEGSEYGDNITYDLARREVHTEEWFMVRESQTGPTEELEIQTPEGETRKITPKKKTPKAPKPLKTESDPNDPTP
jgi:hypothetical protein